MLFNAALALCALGSASLVATTPAAISACGEKADRVCFGKDGGEAQDVELEDIEYAAIALRSQSTLPNGTTAFWTSKMCTSLERDLNYSELLTILQVPRDFDCAEWMLPAPSGGTLIALAKHVNPRVASSVLFDDIANTIDGGEFATAAQKQAKLLGCARGGGMLGVKVNTSNPAHNTATYKDSKASHGRILINIVRTPI
jgi:hypothetical protein